MKTKDFDILPEETIEIEGKPRPASEFLDDYYKTLGDGTLEYLGIRTGFNKLDKATLGLDGLIVLGGIAGAGKTSLALQLAFEACQLTPTLFYSLEMPRRAILTKILNRLAKVRYSDILLKGRQYLTGIKGEKKLLSDEDANRLKTGKGLLADIGENFYLRTRERDEAEINFKTVEQEINCIKADKKADRVFVVIDHLQAFSVAKYSDQIDKESRLINGFKEISERTGATILLISQKNKAGFHARGLQTIKGSVDIVYLADVVMFLDTPQERKSREDKKKNKSWRDFDDDDDIIAHYGDDPRKDIDLLIEKNRYNAPTTIKMKFNGEHSEFTELP